MYTVTAIALSAFVLAAVVALIVMAARDRMHRPLARWVGAGMMCAAMSGMCITFDVYAGRVTADAHLDSALIVPPSTPNGSLFIGGPIGIHFAARVAASLRAHPVHTIYLLSPGGYVSQALRVAALIRRDRIKVVLMGSCASACVALFAASPDRAMLSYARIGLHEPTFPGVLALLNRVPGADVMIGNYRSALRAGGFNARCVRFTETVAPTSIKLLDIQQVRHECGVRVALQPLPHAVPGREDQHA